MKQKNTFTIGSVLGLLVSILLLAQSGYSVLPWLLKKTDQTKVLRADGSKLDPFDVVLVADESGPNKFIGSDIAKGFTDAIKDNHIENEARLVARDDKGDPNVAAAIASGSAAGFRTLAIVGPTESQAFKSVRDAANEGEVVGLVPIGSPLQEENGKWTFALQASSFKSGVILGRVLQRIAPDGNLVQFVMEGDTVNTLYGGLLEAYKGSGIESIDQAIWPKAAPSAAELKDLITQNTYHDAIIISLPMKEAEIVLREIRGYGYKGTIIFEGEASLEYFADRFNNDSREILKEGYFTNGAISLVPFTPSIARPESQSLIAQYRINNQRDPSWAYSYGYDAGLLIANFINDGKLKQSFTLANPDAMRQKLREYLSKLQTSGAVDVGFTGSLAFDQTNSRNQSPKLVIYNERKQIPYFIQVSDQPVLMSGGDKKDDFVRMGDYGYPVIPVVHSGLNMRSISNINFDQGIFEATFDLWFKSKDPVSLEDIEFMNSMGPLTTHIKTADKQTMAGDSFRGYLVSGKFRFDPKPADLILDQASLGISWRHKALNAKQLQFVVDPEVYDTTKRNTLLGQDGSGQTEVTGFKVTNTLLAVTDRQMKSLGDPRGSHGITSYSVGVYELSLQRNIATVTSQLFNLFGEGMLVKVFIIGSIAFFVMTLLWLARPKAGVQIVFLTAMIVMVVLSETELFTLEVTRSLNTESLALIRITYDLVHILVTIRLLDILLMLFLTKKNKSQGLQPVIIFLTRVSLYFGGAAVFYMGVLNRDILPVLATTSVLLTVVGLALRELIFDAIAGVAISTDGQLKVGDWVSLQSRELDINGRIEQLSWRHTSIRARNGKLHMVPNSRIATQVLSHMSIGSEFVRRDISFYVPIGIDTTKFLPAVAEAVRTSLKDDGTIDQSKPIEALLDGIDLSDVRCVIQVFHASKASDSKLKTVVLEAVRSVLVRFAPVSGPALTSVRIAKA